MYSKMRKTYDQNFRIYSFRQNSELEKFLFAKTGFNLRRFTIKDVIDKLEKIILEEELWDETNQEIIRALQEHHSTKRTIKRFEYIRYYI